MDFPTIQKQGYFLKYELEPESNPEYRHKFCGEHFISGARCPNCDKPLLRFLSIDLNDDQLTFSSKQNILHLLYCWTCNVAQDPFYYKIIGENDVKILKYKDGGVETDFPYEEYPYFFPLQYATLEKIPNQQQLLLSQQNKRQADISEIMQGNPNLAKPQHQVGGEPNLPQGEFDELMCPICNSLMPFLATIGNECDHPEGFCGGDYVAVV
jgi:hypothetical protein